MGWWVLPVAVAIWPVWGYLARSYLAPGAEWSGALLLLGTLGWTGWRCRQVAGAGLSGRCLSEGQAGKPAPPAWLTAALLLGGYAAGYGALPALARAMVGLAAVGAALLALPGLGWRRHSGLVPLLVLAAPAADTLNFFLGGPLRALSAQCAAAWLAAAGAQASGPALWVEGSWFNVDAPCAGVNGLWSALALAAALGVARQLSPSRTAALLFAAAALCAPANGARAAALVHLAHVAPAAAAPSHPAHAAVGLLTFAAGAALLVALAWRWSRPAGGARDGSRAPGLLPDEGGLPPTGGQTARRGHSGTALALPALLIAALSAGLAPLLPARAARLAPGRAFPGWPQEWLGQPLRRLPERAMDRRWAAASGPVARFALPDGEELLLRWVDRPGRGAHPPEDCYRGHGYTVSPLPPTRAALPGTTSAPRWRRFRAARHGEAWEVRAVVRSAAGVTYADHGWWWWRVAGPGASDPGPWWIITRQRRW
jgi:exosortase/archaeosortase family protein